MRIKKSYKNGTQCVLFFIWKIVAWILRAQVCTELSWSHYRIILLTLAKDMDINIYIEIMDEWGFA